MINYWSNNTKKCFLRIAGTKLYLGNSKYNQKNCLVKYSLYCLGFLFYIVIQCFFEGEHIINGYAKDVRDVMRKK